MKVLAAPICFNELKAIGQVVDRFPDGVVDKILVVDDGSDDGSAELVEGKGIEVLRMGERQGVGAAIRAVIRHAVAEGFDIIVILAGNDKDRPAEIPQLVAPIVEHGFDFVQGSRYQKGGEHGNMPLYRRLATGFIHPLLFSVVSGKRITDSTNGFRAIRLTCFEDERINMNQEWLNRYELEPYLFFKFIRLGYKVKEVAVSKIYPSREVAYTKMKPITGWWSILRPIVLLGLRIKK